MGLGGKLAVPVHERGSEVGPTEPFEVHGEKADVVEHITPPEAVAELEAIEHAGTVIEAVDVLGQQVAVTVQHAAGSDAFVEQLGPAMQILGGEQSDLVERGAIERFWDERLELLEVLLPEAEQRSGCRHRGDVRARDALGVRDCHEAGNLPDALSDVSLAAHQSRQPPLGGHAPHAHRVIDHDAEVVDDILHAQVHIGGKAAIQLHLPRTDRRAPLRGAQVDKRKANVLLSLVRHVAVEGHPRDVRLDDVSRTTGSVEDPSIDTHGACQPLWAGKCSTIASEPGK
jgi:hypothetical protein